MSKSLHQTAADVIDTDPQLAREIARQWMQRARRKPTHYGLTERQRDTLDFIESYANLHGGVTPTYDEISDGLAIGSKGRVYRIVADLEERGYIVRLFNRVRSIRLAIDGEKP